MKNAVSPVSRLFAALLLAGGLVAPALADVTLLNASYDVARDFYKDYNPMFTKHWQAKAGEKVEVKQSHGGSSKQVRAVADGLEADVVTMNQATDVDYLADKGLVAKDYAKKFPNNASPYTSTMVFIVRKGNPKALKDWSDLAKSGVEVIVPHPKNTGNGRYTYLAAWGYALKQPGGNDKSALEFVGKILKNAPLFAAGGRDATTTFMQRRLGDVLVTFESEVESVNREFGANKVDVVYPSISIVAENPVAVVERTVAKKGTGELAKAYLQFLYSEQGQEIAAKHSIRPRSPAVLKKYADTFKPIKLFTVQELFGSLAEAQKVHFNDGGLFDKIYTVK